jgi:hypothetical protein
LTLMRPSGAETSFRRRQGHRISRRFYRALEIGLADCFPYKKNRIPSAFHSDHLHIVPDSMKYRKILKS